MREKNERTWLDTPRRVAFCYWTEFLPIEAAAM
jgi:hypothetical protein